MSLVQHIKMFFYKKCVDIFIFFSFNFFFNEHVNICIVIVYLCWIYKKINYFLSFHPPSPLRFFIQNKRHMRRGTIFERGGNSVKQTYVVGGGGGGGTCKTNRNEQDGKWVKNWSFEQTYFFNKHSETIVHVKN